MKNTIDFSWCKIGHLLVIEKTTDRRRGCVIWKCQCECGEFVKVSSTTLSRGNSQSCRRYRFKRSGEILGKKFGPIIANLNRKRPHESLYNGLLLKAKEKAEKGISSSLTFEEFLSFVKIDSCSYCGCLVNWTKFGNGGGYNLDRKVNALGYTKENCAVCCGECNRVKGNVYTFEEMKVIGELLRKLRSSS